MDPGRSTLRRPVPEIIDPVFAKTSQNARFLLSENERFGLVFVKTGSINSGTVVVDSQEKLAGSALKKVMRIHITQPWRQPILHIAGYQYINNKMRDFGALGQLQT